MSETEAVRIPLWIVRLIGGALLTVALAAGNHVYSQVLDLEKQIQTQRDEIKELKLLLRNYGQGIDQLWTTHLREKP